MRVLVARRDLDVENEDKTRSIPKQNDNPYQHFNAILSELDRPTIDGEKQNPRTLLRNPRVHTKWLSPIQYWTFIKAMMAFTTSSRKMSQHVAFHGLADGKRWENTEKRDVYLIQGFL